MKKYLAFAAVPNDANSAVVVSSGAAALITADYSMALFGIPASVLFAVFCGAVIAIRFLPEVSRMAWATNIGIGTIAGGYATPIAAEVVKTEHINSLGAGVGFIAYFILSNAFTWFKKFTDKKVEG